MKEILQQLASIPEDQLSKEDKAMLAELAGKYAGAPAPESKEPVEEAEQANVEPSGQSVEVPVLPEAPAQAEAPKAEGEEALPPEAPVEAAPEANAPEAPEEGIKVEAEVEVPEQPQGGMEMIQQEIMALKASVDNIKQMLEGLSLREPISEEEAEKEEESVGMKGKPGKMVEQGPNITEMLMKKLGG